MQGNADKNHTYPDRLRLQVIKVRDLSIFCLFAPSLSLSYNVSYFNVAFTL